MESVGTGPRMVDPDFFCGVSLTRVAGRMADAGLHMVQNTARTGITRKISGARAEKLLCFMLKIRKLAFGA